MSGRKPKVTIEFIHDEFSKKGAELITSEYNNILSPLQFKCSSCGKVHQITYRKYQLGQNSKLLCRDCMKSVTISDIKKEFKKAGAVLLSETFNTVDTPLLVSCASCGSTFNISWANYKAGHNKFLLCSACRKAGGLRVKIDGKVKLELIRQENNGKALYEKKLSEYSRGYLYIPIFQGEEKSSLLKFMVDIRNGICSNRVYARDCEIAELDTAKEFLNQNHIQGYRKAAITLGLYYKDTLVFVMSFDKPRFNKNYEYELIRLATLHDYVVVGGASRLFKFFTNTYKPKSIISYCDVRFCKPDPDATVYSKLGFKFLYKSESNYRYWNKDLTKSYSRMACQKHRLSGFLKYFDPDKSEYQNMKANGFIKIYDCGNYVFGWNSCLSK